LLRHEGEDRVTVALTSDQVKGRARRAPMVPIFRGMLSDALTPVTAYAALAADGPAYLLESVERGEQLGRYSFVAADPMAIVSIADGRATVQDASGRRDLEGTDPLRALEAYLQTFVAEPADGLPEGFCGGAVGYLGYEAARYLERPPLPDTDRPSNVNLEGHVSQPEFFKAVEKAKSHILAGDIYQVQIAQRFTTPLQAEAFDVYRLLRALNPSPYMYFLKLPATTIIGTSPEI